MNDLQTINTQIDSQSLTDTLAKNTALAERAALAIEDKLKNLPTDFKALDVQTGDRIEAELNELRTRGADSEKLNKDRRMVFTRQFDEMKKLFIEQEKRIAALVEQLKNWMDGWNTEKYRRQEEERKKQEAALAKEKAKVDYRTYILTQFNHAFRAYAEDQLEKMYRMFNGCRLDTIDQHVEKLKTYHPAEPTPADIKADLSQKHPLLDEEEMSAIKNDVLMNESSEWISFYLSKMTEERDKIIASAPGRKEELKRIDNDAEEAKRSAARIAAEEAARKAEIRKEVEEERAFLEQQAANAKMEAAMENAALAPEAELTKGTQVKMKYDVQNHSQMLKIIQWWVTNELPLMTVEEMNKKLSFMRTAAGRALNKDGEVIEGIPTIEDIRTRARRK